MDLDALSPDPRVQAVNADFTRRRRLSLGICALFIAVPVIYLVKALLAYDPDDSSDTSLYFAGGLAVLVIALIMTSLRLRKDINKAHAKAIAEVTGHTPPPTTLP